MKQLLKEALEKKEALNMKQLLKEALEKDLEKIFKQHIENLEEMHVVEK